MHFGKLQKTYPERIRWPPRADNAFHIIIRKFLATKYFDWIFGGLPHFVSAHQKNASVLCCKTYICLGVSKICSRPGNPKIYNKLTPIRIVRSIVTKLLLSGQMLSSHDDSTIVLASSSFKKADSFKSNPFRFKGTTAPCRAMSERNQRHN